MCRFTSYSVQDNCDTSQSCSRGVCLRSCWISTSGLSRRPSSSALSSWPCWSYCQRKEPLLPSVSNIPGSTPRHISSVLIRAQGMSWLASIEQNWGLRQLWDVHITSPALRGIHSPTVSEPFPGCLILKDCYYYVNQQYPSLFTSLFTSVTVQILSSWEITRSPSFGIPGQWVGPFIMTWLDTDPNGWYKSSIDQWCRLFEVTVRLRGTAVGLQETLYPLFFFLLLLLSKERTKVCQ